MKLIKKIKLFILKKVSRRIILIFFFIGIISKMFITASIIYVWAAYLFPIEYTIIDLKISYLFGIVLAFYLVRYWEKFIKRRMHFLIIGDNNKI